MFTLLRLLFTITEEGIKSFFDFPRWWYTRGLLLTINRLQQLWKYSLRATNISVWTRNLFVPMYGDTSLTGRLISFFLRVVMVLEKSVVLLCWFVGLVMIFLGYFLFPLVCLFVFFYHLSFLSH
ncbi:TPA: hypothetical protein DEP34_00010 [Candidatus Uhrbacteria bacterium]|uniref:Uncharacterized protein n=2 Tax=Candidatus Uhriibacteriota TaxID=1752732 RepID=A0A0G1SI64_9BACT|nr:MAG: hypothetical protein UX45_C0002G0002 [Candidatus Uhrbacteria bacterium GW2011_GWF2_46_218]KKU41778.1 MAG: hypothetical protein UX57_C0001G0002 [Candidatus Uhrbacteria bacterium GW2011_GWE2_46_68]HCB18756.1 hypothetical protein [Candidatus Uhrbacteria bacterium]